MVHSFIYRKVMTRGGVPQPSVMTRGGVAKPPVMPRGVEVGPHPWNCLRGTLEQACILIVEDRESNVNVILGRPHLQSFCYS